jgi:hypothetical protein
MTERSSGREKLWCLFFFLTFEKSRKHAPAYWHSKTADRRLENIEAIRIYPLGGSSSWDICDPPPAPSLYDLCLTVHVVLTRANSTVYAQIPMARVLLLSLLAAMGAAQFPNHPPVYLMNKSTIIMPCNERHVGCFCAAFYSLRENLTRLPPFPNSTPPRTAASRTRTLHAVGASLISIGVILKVSGHKINR